MNRKQLLTLVICNVAVFMSGNMVLSLLPVYAVKLGIPESAIGIYLGIGFAAVTLGALSAGWFSDRFQRRKLSIVIASLITIPATYLMGQVSTLPLLTICTVIGWLSAGLITATFNIFVGLYAEPDQRGRIFGIMGMAAALGLALGGFVAGVIVDRWGYAPLYLAAAAVYLVPAAAAWLLDDSRTTARPTVGESKPPAVRLGTAIWLLLVANTLSAVTGFSAGLARPLIMNAMAFEATAIAAATSFSSLITLPLPFFVGWLSDRIGRRQLLIASYAFGAVAMLILIASQEVWQFWFSACLFSVAGAAAGVASAYVTDLATPESLGKALSYMSATGWIGAIFGFTVTGLIVGPLGMTTTLLISAALPVFSILLLSAVRQSPRLAPA
jgi:MFS family permease